jgi:predicted amidophosphoribosyltransferase
MYNIMLSYCGIACKKCEALIATRTNDNSLRAKVADEISVFTGIKCTPEEINCTGCRSDGEKTPYCQRICKVRKCAIKKNVVHCGQCEKYPCPKLNKTFSFAPEAKETLDRLSAKSKKEY